MRRELTRNAVPYLIFTAGELTKPPAIFEFELQFFEQPTFVGLICEINSVKLAKIQACFPEGARAGDVVRAWSPTTYIKVIHGGQAVQLIVASGSDFRFYVVRDTEDIVIFTSTAESYYREFQTVLQSIMPTRSIDRKEP